MIQTAQARRGTSLIEVLVVLVVLVIGILAIARLFPAGFVALRNAENNSYADRLAQGALEQLKQNNGALADAIYMYTDTNNLGFDPNVAPDDLSAFVPDANGYNTTHDFGSLTDLNNNINKQRYISNETVVVGGNRAATPSNYPLQFLTYGPIYLPDSTNLGDYLIVKGQLWTPRTGDARQSPAVGTSGAFTPIDDPRDILESEQSTFMVDYGQGKLAVPAAHYNQTFKVLIQPVTGTAVTLTLVTHSLDATSNPYDGGWFDATSLAVDNANTIPAGPWQAVALYRPFQYLGATTTPNFDADPYEFALYTPNTGPSANMGVLAFNPAAAGRGTGTQALKARISYMALDWHILHEDHDVAAGDANGGPTVRLRLSHLKKVGDIQFDDSVYGGLLPGAPAASQYDVLMLNLDTGAVTGLNGSAGANTQDVDQNDSPNTAMYGVSYQNGRVTFPSNSAAQRVRFYYSGDADWAVAVQKAPSYYTLANPTNPSDATLLTKPSGQRQATDPQTPNLYAIVSTSQVYFPLCDAGKTVEFDGITYTSGGSPRQIGQGTATISTDTVSVGSGLKAVYANLTGGGLNAAGIIPSADTPDAGSLHFNAVRGVSARATVIWRERGIWRSRTLDTLLTQTP